MKFKYLLSIVLVFALCFGVLNLAFADENAEVPEGYTPIYTAEDLNNIRNDLDGKYILMNDIDLSVYENWKPIGTSETPFTGELNGNRNSIINLTISESCNKNETYYFGMFGNASSSIIKNITVYNANINISYTGEENSAKCTVGIIAAYDAEVSNCISEGNINVNGFPSSEVGGIVGAGLWNEINNCVNYATINISVNSIVSKAMVGGIIGKTKYTTVSECGNYGKISAYGENVSAKCYTKMGGIEGDGSERGMINNSFNRGALGIDFSNKRTYIGGISGQSRITNNVYNTGEIICHDNFIGYAGAVSGSVYYSALASLSEKSEMKNVYYMDCSLIPAYEGSWIPEDYNTDTFENICLLTEDDFKKQESFISFDFKDIWQMEENGYPVLQNQPVLPENIPERPTTTESTTESTTEPSTESDTETSTESTTESTTEPESTTSPTTEPETTNPDEDDIPYIVRVLIFIWNYIKNIVWNSYEFIVTVLA